MKEQLTDKRIAALKPPATGRLIVADAGAPGLTLRLTPATARYPDGTRSWLVRYRPRMQAQRYSVLGPYPAIKLSEARQRARELDVAAKRGVDLIEEEQRKVEDEKARVEAARLAQERARTFADVAEDYMVQCQARLRSWKIIEGRLRNHVLPVFGPRPIGAIRRADIVELLDDLEHGDRKFRHQVNRVREVLLGVFNFALERELIDANPAAATRKRKVEKPRERVLTAGELKAIWQGSGRISPILGAFIRALMLTGGRRNEVSRLRWAEIDLDNRIWTLPPDRAKSERAHEIPLSEPMVAVLEGIGQQGGPFVFSADGGRPINSPSWVKKEIDAASGVRDWRFHDVRRTFRTGLAELGISHAVAERCLGHAVPMLERTYNTHVYRAEKARALEAWADHLLRIAGEGREAGNVVELRQGA
jgi:integrase